jgi:serine/threonine protein kinase
MTEGSVRVVGRYAMHGEIAAGGMATVHLGRLLGPVGFAKTVAIKRLHPQFAKDPEFVAMFLDEARLAARIQHPNVVSTLDVVSQDGELFLVMEYIEGESLARLIRGVRANGTRLPPTLVGSVMSAALYGLHAAHEAKGPDGAPLGIIHRDISPQNIHIGLDGVSRVLDFGVAKATNRAQITREGQLKGKLPYMAPEQIMEDDFDRRVDVYAAGVVLWEALCAKRLFDGENEGKILKKIISTEVVPPSSIVPGLSPHVDAIVLRALAKDPSQRFATAWELAVAIEETLGTEAPRRLGAFVESIGREGIEQRSARVRQLESAATERDAAIPPGPASDPSAMERTVAKRAPASARATLAVLAILGLGATAALIILLVKRGSEPAATPAASERPAPSALEAPLIAASGAESAAGSPPLSASVAASPPTSAPSPRSASAPPLTPKTSATAAARPTAVASARPTATATPPNDACKVPTYYENGIKKIKPECLK